MLRSVLAPGGEKNWLQLQIKVCKHTFKNYLRFEITLTFFLFQDLFYSIYTNLDETEKNLLESGSFYPASAKITGSATLRPVNIKLFQLCLICIGEAKARIGWYWVSQSWRISPVDVGRFPGRYITIIVKKFVPMSHWISFLWRFQRAEHQLVRPAAALLLPVPLAAPGLMFS